MPTSTYADPGASAAVSRRALLPHAAPLDTLGMLAGVAVPTLAKGVIIRRRWAVALAELLDLDHRAVRRMQRLRARYGEGPVLLPVLGRQYAVILTPEHVWRVLERTPEPFATAAPEKRAALRHFEPKGVLSSHGAPRAVRRRFNEAVLETHRAIHRLAEPFVDVVEDESERLLRVARQRGVLRYDDFSTTWFRMVRRVVLGDVAANDRQLTDELARLRARGNWSVLAPVNRHRRRRFLAHLNRHLERAEPGSLAGVIARTSATPTTAPVQQVPQWLFAFDAAGIATYRALWLLATHPRYAQQAWEEAAAVDAAERHPLPLLRATILESVRLWPTTPIILRESTRETAWENGLMPARTGVLIYVPFFHRDDERLPFADRFAPELWLNGQSAAEWPLIPFSAGPAECPGRNLVLLLGSAMLAALGREAPGRLRDVRPAAGPRLPGTLNYFRTAFDIDAPSHLAFPSQLSHGSRSS